MSNAPPSIRSRRPPARPSRLGPPGGRDHAVAGGVEVLIRIVVALAVAAGLSSDRLVRAAEQRPYGTTRSALVSAAGVVEHGAAEIGITGTRAVFAAIVDASAEEDARLGGESAVSDARGGDSGAVAGPSTIPAEPEGLPHPGPPRPTGPDSPTTAGPPRPTSTTSPTTAGLPRPTSTTSPTTAGPPRPTSTTSPTTAGPPRPTSTTSPTTAGPPRPTSPDRASDTVAAEPVAARPTTTARSVDEAAKLRIWAGGDSLGEYVGNQLLSPLGDPDLTEVELSYHISTGLARPDYFDWEAEFESVMTRAEPPEALVYMVGGNDDQGMRNEAGNLRLGSKEWEVEYARRAAHLMDLAETGSAHLYWIGLPPMRDGRREEVSVRMNRVVEREAGTRPWVTFLETTTLFSDAGGGYAAQLPDPGGRLRVVRAPDGVHVNYNGSEWIAERVWAAIVDRWRLDGPTAVGPPPGAR